MYQQQNVAMQGYNQATHVPLQDGDLANVVLNELKRVAREYTTACLEADNSDIRHLFEQLLHQTLRDQEHLYQIMSQLNLYGQPSSAAQNELQKEMNNHQQQLGGLQGFMQQWHGASRGGQADYRQNANIQQQQAQQNQHNQQNYQIWHNQQIQDTLRQQNQQNQQRQQNQQFQQNQHNEHNLQNQQHHSSAVVDVSRETGSEQANNHTTGAPFTQ